MLARRPRDELRRWDLRRHVRLRYVRRCVLRKRSAQGGGGRAGVHAGEEPFRSTDYGCAAVVQAVSGIGWATRGTSGSLAVPGVVLGYIPDEGKSAIAMLADWQGC